MGWIFLSAAAPFFWALNNVFDQHLSRKYFHDSAAHYIAASGLVSFVVGTGVLLFSGHDQPFTWLQIFSIVGLGAMLDWAYIPYIKALQDEEAGIAVPLFHVSPVAVFILAWAFLGESVGMPQLLAAALIILASVGISIDFENHRFRFRTFWLMMISVAGISLFAIGTRYLVQDLDWLRMSGWSMIGSGVAGCVVFAIQAKGVAGTVRVFGRSGAALWLSFIAAELCYDAGIVLYHNAILLAPSVGLVETIGGIQPFFVILFAAVFAFVSPETVRKVRLDRYFAWQVACMLLMVLGLYLLNMLS